MVWTSLWRDGWLGVVWQYKLDATGNCCMRMKKWKNARRRMMVSDNGGWRDGN